jgi:hypothetical protein
MALAGCRTVVPHGNGAEVKWGHLADESLLPTSPQFLINKKPGDKFKICLARYMADLFPGVEAELDAAVNVWAAYLGRKIPVEVTLADLPRAQAGQTEEQVGTLYQKICGDGFDTVVGMVGLQGTTLGLTGASFRFFPKEDGTREIVSFQRFLFVRDFAIGQKFDGGPTKWVSRQQRTGKPTNKDELLATMLRRDTLEFAPRGESLLLPVLTHEVGHIWGMCDQYESANNCDKAHSTSHLVLGAQMGAKGLREMSYLTDDDVEGVRALVARPGFTSGWPDTPALKAAPVALVPRPVELFRIDGVSRQGTRLVVDYGVVTTKATRLNFFLRRHGEEEWQGLEPGQAADKGLDQATARLGIGLGNPAPAGLFDVKLELATEPFDKTDKLEATEVAAPAAAPTAKPGAPPTSPTTPAQPDPSSPPDPATQADPTSPPDPAVDPG